MTLSRLCPSITKLIQSEAKKASVSNRSLLPNDTASLQMVVREVEGDKEDLGIPVLLITIIPKPISSSSSDWVLK